jgi:hypothetical protein
VGQRTCPFICPSILIMILQGEPFVGIRTIPRCRHIEVNKAHFLVWGRGGRRIRGRENFLLGNDRPAIYEKDLA